MNNTIFYSLIFDYNINTMTQSGRHWASTAYKNKDYIFSYSAASLSTVIHHNKDIKYHILCDDVELLKDKLDYYNVDKNLFIFNNIKNTINEWKNNQYCFWPLIKSMDYMCDEYKNNTIVKLDNDLTCLKKLDVEFYNHNGSHVWKFERECSSGRDYWGEKLAAKVAFGTDNFKIYNTGIWSINPQYFNVKDDIKKYCISASNVDISSVSHFPDKPGVKAKTWACADQTSNNYWLHKNKIPTLETYKWFNHHCYVTNKEGVIEQAKYLRKV